MVQTWTPPIHTPKGTRLPHLVPFKAKVSRKGVMQRGDGCFGSMGTPQVMFTLPLAGSKTIKPVTFQHPNGGTLTTKAALLDKGSDVIIVPSFAWLATWPLNTLGTLIIGVGGVQLTGVSQTLLTVWVDEEAHICSQVKPYMMNTTTWLLGRDTLNQMGFCLTNEGF